MQPSSHSRLFGGAQSTSRPAPLPPASGGSGGGVTQTVAALPGSDLGAALKSYRTRKAGELSQPSYCVFTNAELDALVAACPRSTGELGLIKGFGPAKMSKFGDDIVAICSSGLSRPSPGAIAAAAAAATTTTAASTGSTGGGVTSDSEEDVALTKRIERKAQEPIQHKPPPTSRPAPLPPASGGSGGGVTQTVAALPGSDLGAALKSYRTRKAGELSQPSYCVFTNAELDALVAACPRSTGELGLIKGFGPAKMSKFGDDIVAICSSGLSRPSPGAIAAAAAAATTTTAASTKRKLPSSSEASSSSVAALPAAPRPPQIPRSALNEEQSRAAQRVLGGQNVFLTGAAGVGKSYLLRFIIQELEGIWPGAGQVPVTAPTGRLCTTT